MDKCHNWREVYDNAWMLNGTVEWTLFNSWLTKDSPNCPVDAFYKRIHSDSDSYSYDSDSLSPLPSPPPPVPPPPSPPPPASPQQVSGCKYTWNPIPDLLIGATVNRLVGVKGATFTLESRSKYTPHSAWGWLKIPKLIGTAKIQPLSEGGELDLQLTHSPISGLEHFASSMIELWGWRFTVWKKIKPTLQFKVNYNKNKDESQICTPPTKIADVRRYSHFCPTRARTPTQLIHTHPHTFIQSHTFTHTHASGD